MSTVLPIAFLVLLGAWLWTHELRLVRRKRRASHSLTEDKTRPARVTSPGRRTIAR